MARVAANQDSAEAVRAHYVYIQHARVSSHKGKKIMCEETTDSRVTPADKGSHQQLLKLDGRLLQKGKYTAYTELPKSNGASGVTEDHDLNISVGDDDSDRDLVENMRHNLIDTSSKDGIGANLFPLTTKQQADEVFTLIGREHINGRDVFHITFRPKDKDDFGWRGDAYIDTAAYQPVLVRTAMSRNIPFAVRTLLGTNVPGLGFTVIYAPQADGVWFPISFGTEFKIHVLFFFRREITLSAENRDFEKTHVTSHILDGVAATDTSPVKQP
ncbi:MAG: hypothetical protein M3R43_10820 [Acidobacteriota bacterium]|nr:hypothetical protein [Acidobacteriota bacterium]